MNLLILSTWFPYPADNGSRVRIFNLIRQLSGHFSIRLVAGAQEDSPQEIPDTLRALCDEVVRVPWVWHDSSDASFARAMRALASPVPRSILETPNTALQTAIAAQIARPTDAILVCELGMDAYLPQRRPSIPIVMDGAEITGMRQTYLAAASPRARLRAGLMYTKGMRYWRRALSRYDIVTAASADEADALRSLVGSGGPQFLVIPNGVEIGNEPLRNPAQIRPGRLIYNGALTYGPNRVAVEFFVRDVLPLIASRVSDAHLVVTGRYTSETAGDIASNPRVELTGYLDDLKPTLASAAVCVVPLQSGGGTRLKILEAWGVGVPVVSTAVGAAGLAGAIPGEHILIADHPDDMADAVLGLLSNPESGSHLAANARQLAETRYSWSGAAAPLIAGLRGAKMNGIPDGQP